MSLLRTSSRQFNVRRDANPHVAILPSPHHSPSKIRHVLHQTTLWLGCVLIAGVCLAPQARAQSAAQVSGEIFLCIDEQGNRTYQNMGNIKGCKRLDIQPVTTVPAIKIIGTPPSSVAHNGSNGYQKSNYAQNGSANGTSSAGLSTSLRLSNSPSNFPRVDGDTQKSRDLNRRKIIEDELRNEEMKLAGLRRDFNGGEPERMSNERNYQTYVDRVNRMRDDIQRTEGNVNSLRRELSMIRE
jgi:hypothetical protein